MKQFHISPSLPTTPRVARALRVATFAGLMAGLAGCAASSAEDLTRDLASEEQGSNDSDRMRGEQLPADNAALPRISFLPDRAAAAERLARRVASSLRDADVRRALYESMAASPVKEGKLHLGTYLHGRGRALLTTMLEESAGSDQEINGLLDTTGQLEIYMPVKAHRAKWNGDEDVIVATQLDEKTVPFGVDLRGEPVALSREAPPEVPTISIVPAESFLAEGAPKSGHLVQNMTAPIASLDINSPGLRVEEVHIQDAGSYEGWLLGDPEFEMHLMNGDTRASIVCAHEGAIAPYQWDMNGDDYATPFLLASSDVIPSNTKLVIAVYEDDDTRCKIVQDKDYVKLVTDAVTNGTGAYKGVLSKDYLGAALALYKTYLATKAIVTGNDEFVGIAGGTYGIGTSSVDLTLLGENTSATGWIRVRLTTVCGNGICDTGEAGKGCISDCGS